MQRKFCTVKMAIKIVKINLFTKRKILQSQVECLQFYKLMSWAPEQLLQSYTDLLDIVFHTCFVISCKAQGPSLCFFFLSEMCLSYYMLLSLLSIQTFSKYKLFTLEKIKQKWSKKYLQQKLYWNQQSATTLAQYYTSSLV